MPGASMLDARGLVVERNGRRTLDGLNLSVASGTVYALLGANGAGKTTALNAFLGFVVPSQGEVRVDDRTVDADPQAARDRLAYLPENVALYPFLTGLENLRYFCTLAGIWLSREQAKSLLDEVGLPITAYARRASAYSKGMRQKVGLAIAHAKKAKAMLLDEPTSGLDPSAADDFARRVRDASEAGMAILMATHDLTNALQVADRIGIMRDGRLVDEFDASDVDYAALARKYLRHVR